MRQGVLISTTEHLLSVFYSCGIDNAYIEINNLEVPILDGSGLPFLELIQEAGVRHYRRKRRYLRVRPADHGRRQRQANQHFAGRQFPADVRDPL